MQYQVVVPMILFVIVLVIYFLYWGCRDTLMSIAKHYETGETLPEETFLKLLAARTFRAGSLSLRQVSAISDVTFS